MPVFDSGYFMRQDYIHTFVMKQKHEVQDEHEEVDSTLAVIMDIDNWWLGLPRDMQKRTAFFGSRRKGLS